MSSLLGSGVVGVASAWYLSQAGHDVTVIDRQPGPAEETQRGQRRADFSRLCGAWAAPGVPLKAIKWMFQRHAPLAIGLDGTSFQLMERQMLRNCDTRHYMENKGRMVRLAEYSRDCLKRCATPPAFSMKGARAGRCSCSVPPNSMKMPPATSRVLEDAGVPYQLLEAKRLAEGGAGAGGGQPQTDRRPAPAK